MKEIISKFTILFLLFTIMSLAFSSLLLAKPPVQGKHKIIVSKDGDGDFATITEALNSITDASDTNRYRISVKPGIYNEQIAMKSYVDIVGSGQENTTLTYDGNDATISWTANNAALENLTVTGGGVPIQIIRIDASAVIRNTGVIIPEAVQNGIYTGRGASLQLFNSKIIFNGGTRGNVFGISVGGGSLLVSDCIIEMNTTSDAWALGIYAEKAQQATISKTVIKITGHGYGMTAKNAEIIDSKISVESSTTDKHSTIGIESRGQVKILNSEITTSTAKPTNKTIGVIAGRGNTIIKNSTVSSSLFGVSIQNGTLEVNDSTISGKSMGIERGRYGSFRIVSSQIKGGHDGVKGIDKVINCRDENNDPIPDL